MAVAMYVVASLHRPSRCSVTSGRRVNKQAAFREFIMNINRAITTSAMLLTFVVGAGPALAASSDQNGRDRRPEQAARAQPNNGGNNARSETKAAPASGRETSRSSASDARRVVARPPVDNRDQVSGRQTRGSSAGNVRRDVAVPRAAPPVETSMRSGDRQSANRQHVTPQSDGRQYNTRPYDNRGYNTRPYDNRGYNTRPYDNRGYNTRGYVAGRYDTRWYSNGRYGYRPYVSYPGLLLGLGISIFAGHPYGFRFDYGWAPSYAYRFPMRSGIGYGGMSFLIDPDDAAVYVDGEFIGYAREFDGQPVPLAAGAHRIELQADGRAPVMFNISVRPGQVIPYRGSLMPTR
jgi:hypothetical protein